MLALDQINHFFVDVWSRIEKLEERALSSGIEDEISITEMHIIEKIGNGAGLRMSDIARSLGITLATLTVACDKLVSKQLIVRNRGEMDKRVVTIQLTPKGQAAYTFHKTFHDNMVRSALANLTENECAVLGHALEKLQQFFLSFANEELLD